MSRQLRWRSFLRRQLRCQPPAVRGGQFAVLCIQLSAEHPSVWIFVQQRTGVPELLNSAATFLPTF